MLWGLALVGVPVLIHLLMRQRPRPLPWAAMRWLAAAMKRTQRRFRLTNLLLLLLRCLVVALAALALARPVGAGTGRGEHLLLVVDATASMGERFQGAGGVERLADELAAAADDYTVISIVRHGANTGALLRRGDGEAAEEVLAKLRTDPVPGGLAQADATVVEALADDETDVLLVSDFRQDDARALLERLSEIGRWAGRWRIGSVSPSGVLAAVEPPDDLLPEQPGWLTLSVDGEADRVQVRIDGGEQREQPVGANGRMRLSIPPLAAGPHRVQVQLVHDGLQAGSDLTVPMLVRDPVPVVVVGEGRSALTAAIAAAPRELAMRRVGAVAMAQEALPEGGAVVLGATVAGGERLREWLEGGGVAWATLDRLRDQPGLADVVADIELGEERQAGALTVADARLEDSYRALTQSAAAWAPAAEDRVLLAADGQPLVVERRLGRGRLLIELPGLDEQFWFHGATPLWVMRTLRQATARDLLVLAQGDAAPAGTWSDAGEERQLAAGQPLRLAPGWWRATEPGQRHLLVLPHPGEWRLGPTMVDAAPTELLAALPEDRGADWGQWLLVAVLLMLAVEGAVAAAAGRRYTAHERSAAPETTSFRRPGGAA